MADSIATFGGGCFWCTEAVFQQLAGVESVVSGYAGGHVQNPDYNSVCTGTTGHAEVIQIQFDSTVIGYGDLLEAFFRTHDPTTLNQQGADRGTQYRSVIYYSDDVQRETAEQIIQLLDDSGAFAAPIVTEISPLPEFYPAEDYHQDYFLRNPEQSYCAAVIAPKVEKFQQVFSDRLRT